MVVMPLPASEQPASSAHVTGHGALDISPQQPVSTTVARHDLGDKTPERQPGGMAAGVRGSSGRGIEVIGKSPLSSPTQYFEEVHRLVQRATDERGSAQQPRVPPHLQSAREAVDEEARGRPQEVAVREASGDDEKREGEGLTSGSGQQQVTPCRRA